MKHIMLVIALAALVTACSNGRKVIGTTFAPSKSSSVVRTAKESFGTRRDVVTDSGYITMHPLNIEIEIGPENVLHCFFVMNKHIMFITENKDLYQKFSNHIPERNTTQHSVVLFGPLIDPFTTFSQAQLRTVSNQVKRALGVELNNYKIARIANYELRDAGGIYISKEFIDQMKKGSSENSGDILKPKSRTKDGFGG